MRESVVVKSGKKGQQIEEDEEEEEDRLSFFEGVFAYLT